MLLHGALRNAAQHAVHLVLTMVVRKRPDAQPFAPASKLEPANCGGYHRGYQTFQDKNIQTMLFLLLANTPSWFVCNVCIEPSA